MTEDHSHYELVLRCPAEWSFASAVALMVRLVAQDLPADVDVAMREVRSSGKVVPLETER